MLISETSQPAMPETLNIRKATKAVDEGRFDRRIRLPDGSYLADISMARFRQPG